MNYHWLIPLFAVLANAVLGVVVYKAKRGSNIGSVFAVLACVLVIWNFYFLILYSVRDSQVAFELTWFLRMGVMFVPPVVFHLSVALRQRRSRFGSAILTLDYGCSAVLALANAEGLVVSGLRPVEWGFSSVSGPMYGLFTFSLIFNFLASMLLMLHDYRTSIDPRVRIQLQFWLLGAVVALPLGATNLLPAYGFPIYPLGSLGNTVWAGVVAYAIVRHRLMDVDLVVTKGVGYVATALLLVTPAFLLVLQMQQRIFGSIHYDFSFALLVMFVAIGVFFPSLRLRTESQVERTFFSQKHAYRVALSAFAKSVVRILDRDKLIAAIATELGAILRVDRVAVFVRDVGGDRYRLAQSVGIPPADDEYHPVDAVPTILARVGDALLRDEIEQRGCEMKNEIARVFDANGWEVCLPLAASGNLIGFVALGRKRSLDVFSVVDVDLLGSIAAQVAIALENARLYEELHKSRDIIRRADRMSALGTLAAGIAHEIRNPLVSIQTFFQLAPARLEDEEFMSSFFNLAETEVRRIADLVSELLTFARSQPDAVVDVDLDETIDRAVRLLSPQAHAHRVTLDRVGERSLLAVNVDADRIKQVLINIILNGIQATPEGGTVSVSTGIIQHRDREFYQISISDTGVGISAAMQEDIFNPFFTTKDKGTGLGLSIAHQIVSEHGGFITVKSREGIGSIFEIHLPVAGKAEESISAKAVG